MGVTTLVLVWLLGTSVIVAVGIGRDDEPIDRHKALSLFVIAASWPLLAMAFVLGVLIWLVGLAVHFYQKRWHQRD